MSAIPALLQKVLRVIFVPVLVLLMVSTLAKAEDFAQEVINRITQIRTGDYDGMVKRRAIRVLVGNNRMQYCADQGKIRGLTYELFQEFEKVINKDPKNKALQTQIFFIPMRNDELLSALAQGRGDIAAANLTITPERQKLVDFSDPLLTDVKEIVVTVPNGPKLTCLNDLAGQEVWVRASSSYYGSLQRLNASLKKEGKSPVKIEPVDELLQDDDILEMVNAGIFPITVVDNHIAEFYAQIFKGITLHPDLALNTGGKIAWAIRKNSPQLQKVVNDFIKDHKKGTLIGNMMFKRYLGNVDWIKNPVTEAELKKFRATIEFFKKYAGEYNFDWLLIASQGYQESQLNQDLRSPRGAVGVMQVLPSTAANHPVNINNVTMMDNNIHAGVKYLRFMIDNYFQDEKIDTFNRYLFAMASYNAGPAKISALRRKAAQQGIDPNQWFNNVELVAAQDIGQETVRYVGNIYKYYVSFRRILELREMKKKAINKN
jgi:membrane-bound lytic murein transglycosylase MltF